MEPDQQLHESPVQHSEGTLACVLHSRSPCGTPTSPAESTAQSFGHMVRLVVPSGCSAAGASSPSIPHKHMPTRNLGAASQPSGGQGGQCAQTQTATFPIRCTAVCRVQSFPLELTQQLVVVDVNLEVLVVVRARTHTHNRRLCQAPAAEHPLRTTKPHHMPETLRLGYPRFALCFQLGSRRSRAGRPRVEHAC